MNYRLELEGTKGVIRIRTSKDRQQNGRKKKDKQRSTKHRHKTKESEEHLLLKCSFYYTSRRKLLQTIKNNINHSNFEKLSFGDKFIWLLNSESKDILICMCDFLLKSHCFG